MRGIRLAAGVMAAGLLAWAGAARAEDADTVRLGRTEDAPAQDLIDDGTDADTISVYRAGAAAGGRAVAKTPFGTYKVQCGAAAGVRGGGYGGARGYGGYGYGGACGYGGYGYGGYRAGYGGYGYGGYRAGYGGYGYGGYRGYGYGGYGYGGYRGYGYGGYGGYGYGGGCYPCVAVGTVGVATLALPPPVVSYSTGTVVEVNPVVPVAPAGPAPDATYPYDGGPANPVPTPQPMPKADPAPANPAPAPATAPTRSVPLEGRAVSLPKSSGKWAYPAYGEQARRTSEAQDRTLVIKK
jgi:hypothetical protein